MDLAGKTALVTGATSGIGLAIAERLAGQVGTLIVHGPQPEAEQADLLRRLRSQGASQVVYLQADFAKLADVVALVRQVRRTVDHVDLLVNNAVAGPTHDRVVTVDGFERALQVDYLAMVALTVGLRDIIRERIVNIASDTHQSAAFDFDDLQLEKGFTSFDAYQRAKLAIVTYTRWLASRLSANAPTVVAICPGLTDTPLLRASFPGMTGQPVADAVENVFAGITGDAPSGTYMHDGSVGDPNPLADQPAVQARLIASTEAMLGVSLEEAFPAIEGDLTHLHGR